MPNHTLKYTPIIIGASQRYRLELPNGLTPVRWWTMTTDMRSWLGEVVEVTGGAAVAVVRQGSKLVTVTGHLSSAVKTGWPCCVMEHLRIDGTMEYLIGTINIQMENKNFVNFGIPNGKHLRIDIYTGESRIINA